MTTRDPVESFGDKLSWAVAQAVRAPSTHNTQPWRFRVHHAAIEVRADPSRALAVADPERRELTLSVGAALGHLLLALRSRGLDAEVDRLPDPRDRDLLARVKVRPGASPTEDERALVAAIATRHTSRAPYLGITIPDDLVEALVREAEAEGAWLVPLREESDRVRLVAHVMEADRRQWEDHSFRREFAHWMRPNDSAARDGIFGYSAGLDNVESHLARLAARVLDRGAHEAVEHAHLAEASPLLVVLGTVGDWALPWLRAGEALSRVLLRAESESLRASFLNPPLEIAELRDRVGELTGRVGSPQVILRLGYGLPGPATPRRTLDEVLGGV